MDSIGEHVHQNGLLKLILIVDFYFICSGWWEDYTDNKFLCIHKWSSPHSLLSSSATILLVLWSANSDAPFQGKFQVILLNDDTYQWNCATSSYRQIE